MPFIFWEVTPSVGLTAPSLGLQLTMLLTTEEGRDLECNASVLSWAGMKAIATCRGYPDSKSLNKESSSSEVDFRILTPVGALGSLRG